MNKTFSLGRVKFLSVLFTLLLGFIVFRLVQVQIVNHNIYMERAEKQWHEKEIWHARRGSIFDRNGVPLAITHNTFTVGISPACCPRSREVLDDLAEILPVSRQRLKKLMSLQREYVQLAKDQSLTEEEIGKLSSITGVKLDQSQKRLYPLKSVPIHLLGKVNCEGGGVGGVEAAFDHLLSGENGWLLINKDAKNRAIPSVNSPGKKPQDGRDLYLTMDSRVQAVTDFELASAVDKYGARWGVAVVIHPETGEIIALSERFKEDYGDGHGGMAIHAISCIYEPGSTFKLITDSFLLDGGMVDPYDVFYAEGGEADFEFGTFRDDHPVDGWLTFRESFVKSSNICTIKAVMGSDPEDFYRHIIRFGFGGWTGIPLPAESRGTISPPDRWSDRSLPSISIGHEIGVTPIQMIMAYGAVCNGGKLLTPRLIHKVKDQKGRVINSSGPVEVRRVVSLKTVETLKEFCRKVVINGTGKLAKVDGIEVGGKTGTSQKSNSNGYIENAYTASFIGFAPFDEPEIICLVMLDQPDFPYYYGGQSSAVVFSRIVKGINLSTNLFYKCGDYRMVMEERDEDLVEVPNFLKLSGPDAVVLASSCGLCISQSSGEGMVYSQSPSPGNMIERGGEVKILYLPVKETRSEKVRVPNILGLSIREARRLLVACGLSCRLRGMGLVEEQFPCAGSLVSRGYEVLLRCSLKDVVSRKHGVGEERNRG
jgi:stage V sporulation protein D (sporulation-specific penicillin-binding protein)